MILKYYPHFIVSPLVVLAQVEIVPLTIGDFVTTLTIPRSAIVAPSKPITIIVNQPKATVEPEVPAAPGAGMQTLQLFSTYPGYVFPPPGYVSPPPGVVQTPAIPAIPATVVPPFVPPGATSVSLDALSIFDSLLNSYTATEPIASQTSATVLTVSKTMSSYVQSTASSSSTQISAIPSSGGSTTVRVSVVGTGSAASTTRRGSSTAGPTTRPTSTATLSSSITGSEGTQQSSTTIASSPHTVTGTTTRQVNQNTSTRPAETTALSNGSSQTPTTFVTTTTRLETTLSPSSSSGNQESTTGVQQASTTPAPPAGGGNAAMATRLPTALGGAVAGVFAILVL